MNAQLAAAAQKNTRPRVQSKGRKNTSKSPFRQAASKPRLTTEKSSKSILDNSNVRTSHTQGQFQSRTRDDKSCPPRGGPEQIDMNRKKSFSTKEMPKLSTIGI